ncbi:choice-of-anchor J domain-containing protein [candidate division KSB1 bacterium]|nr:choice-of-anchor J domain-containing protein [candidate division KSB1 bacterium]
MRKLLTILLVIVLFSFITNLYAQNMSRYIPENHFKKVHNQGERKLFKPQFHPLLFESFENEFPPNGWRKISYGNSGNEWRQDASMFHSGSYSASVKFSAQNETMDEWLITPAIDLSQSPGAKLLFFEDESYWKEWGVHHYIKISTTSPTNKSSFQILTDMTPGTHDINGFAGNPVEIDLSNFIGEDTVYIAFQYTGTYADDWYIDDVGVYEPDEHDVRVNSISLESHYDPGTTVQPKALVENVGLNTETFSVDFGYLDWDNNPIVVDTKTVENLPIGHSEEITFNDYVFNGNFQYIYFVQTQLITDMDNSNDLIKQVTNTFTKTKQNVLVEKATGTWCGYCPGSALAIDKLYHNYPENLVVLEYHSGDPYENEMSKHRIDMYGVAGFPTAIFDGTEWHVGGTAADDNWMKKVYNKFKNTFLSQQNVLTGFSLELDVYRNENGFTAQTKTTYEAVLHSKSYRLFFALNESHIYERWQGLDSLQFVARAMFPDHFGLPVYEGTTAPAQGLSLPHSVDFDLPEGVIEENCHLIAFIQNTDTKEIAAVQKYNLSQTRSNTQKFRVMVSDTVAWGSVNEEIALGGKIINKTDNPLEITISRASNDIPENWTSSLCFATCAAPHIDNISETIPARDTVEFSIHFFTSSEPAKGEAVLTIEDQRRTSSVTYSFEANSKNPTSVATTGKPSLSYKLLGSYPNPFNSSTAILFETAEKIRTLNFKVYSLLGQLVYEQKFQNLSAGLNQISYNGTDSRGNNLTSGIYIYQLSFKTQSGIKKSFSSRFVNLK